MTGFVTIRSASKAVSVSGTTYTLEPGPDVMVTRPYFGQVPAAAVPKLLKFPYDCEVVPDPLACDPGTGPGASDGVKTGGITDDKDFGTVKSVVKTGSVIPVVTPPTLYPTPIPIKAGDLIDTRDGLRRIVRMEGSSAITEPATVAA